MSDFMDVPARAAASTPPAERQDDIEWDVALSELETGRHPDPTPVPPEL